VPDADQDDDQEGLVPSWAAVPISVAFMVLSVLLTYLLVALWPSDGEAREVSKRVFWGWDWKLDADQHLVVLVLLTSALGGTARSLLELTKRMGDRDLMWRYTLSYAAFPGLGGILALALYIVIRAGFVGFDDQGNLNVYGYLAISVLTGLFAHLVVAKLRQIAESVFAKDVESEGKPGDPAPEERPRASQRRRRPPAEKRASR
jgi:hypothetical protein